MIEYITDIHMDIGKLPEVIEQRPGKTLLIAGDTCELRYLHNPKGLDNLKRICDAYEKVYTICGNHEFYGENIDTGYDKYRNLTKRIDNFQILENEAVDLGDYTLLGTTLWTDYKNQDPEVLFICQRVMNDHVYIATHQDDITVTFKPYHAHARHIKAVAFLLDNIIEATKPVIVMTHHAPMMEHCNAQRRADPIYDLVNYAYATDLGHIVKHPNIAAWVHGHTHDEKITWFDGMPLQTFARGYYKNDFVTTPLLLRE